MLTYISPLTQKAAEAYNELYRLMLDKEPVWKMIEPMNRLRVIVEQLEKERAQAWGRSLLGSLIENHPERQKLEAILSMVEDEDYQTYVRRSLRKGAHYG